MGPSSPVRAPAAAGRPGLERVDTAAVRRRASLRVRKDLLPVVPVALAALLLTGCTGGPSPAPSASRSGDGSAVSPNPTSTTGSPTPSPSSSGTASGPSALPTTGGSGTPAGFSPAPVTGGTEWPGPAQARLVRVAVGTHAGYDRLVLEFAAGPVPTFEVAPQEDAVFSRDASDAEVVLRGDSGVRVVLRGTTVAPTARDWLLPAYPAIREVEQLGDFEAVVSYGVGVAGTAQVRVTTLGSPARLVVDVLQP